ncbi:hypothetical protein [Gordonia liuliyuniae]|uniref:Uncharacterized protein n=1 Tax=Gordonia liuliyuniae TaxID=2911517 RepID=A0ABS9IYD0_9ACTN|nr:hypothetical protein [Gordonia liuliyuniae]MCF8590581.1 hypothetical protein [Gordonia liuliyuniae]
MPDPDPDPGPAPVPGPSPFPLKEILLICSTNLPQFTITDLMPSSSATKSAAFGKSFNHWTNGLTVSLSVFGCVIIFSTMPISF